METNRVTLATYQESFDKYVAASGKNLFVERWLKGVLSRIEHESPILEIGAGAGWDAQFVYDLGYENIGVTDAFDAAVDALKARGFADAKKLNILTDEPEGEYDLIFASAVFLHFTEREFETVLQRLHGHLGKSGLLAFTVKEGNGEEWSNAKMDAPRFFHYWREEPLRQSVYKCGYKVVDVTTNEEFGQKWLAVTALPSEL